MLGLVVGLIAALIAWYIWAALMYFIGAKILPEPQTEADIGQLLRTTGFASSPGILRVLGLVPGLWGLVWLITAVWMLVATVIAARQALDYRSTFRAVVVVFLAWLVAVIVGGFLLALLGGPVQG